MKPGQHVFGVGLPRCGGQTLQKALSILLPKPVVHSPGDKLPYLKPDSFSAAVEVFAPIPWLLNKFDDPLFICNIREAESWLKSCTRMYPKSAKWNHPIWKYPLPQFVDYRDEYMDTRKRYAIALKYTRFLMVDLTGDNQWEPLCNFLKLPEPSVPFPNVDQVGRPVNLPLPGFEVKFNG